MATLAEIDDLEAVMARALTNEDKDRAFRLLEIASKRVRTFTGQRFELTTSTVTLKVHNGRVRLPQWPVVSVASVVDLFDNAVTFEWNGLQVINVSPTRINAFEINLSATSVRTVVVTYQHGTEDIPDDVIGVVCDMTAAALDSPPEVAGIQSETVGPFSQSYTSTRFPGVLLTQPMKDALAPYMAPGGTVNVS